MEDQRSPELGTQVSRRRSLEVLGTPKPGRGEFPFYPLALVSRVAYPVNTLRVKENAACSGDLGDRMNGLRRKQLLWLSVVVAFALVTFFSGGAIADSGGVPNGGNSEKAHKNEAGTAGNSGQVCDGDPSGHSDTGHGANSGGSYDHNCTTDEEGNPTPSSNGNGDGAATGRPCEGCVGAADDKNPGFNSGKGQQPDGSDNNNGYECDGNNGIGKGNPAHTSCAITPQPPTPPSPPAPPSPPQPPTVGGAELERAPGEARVLGARFVRGQALPATGQAHTIPLAVLGLSLIGVGSVLNHRRERAHNLH